MNHTHSSADRLVRKLQDALGPIIRNALDEPRVVEIMLNPDGKLFIERIGQGITLTGDLDAQSAETMIGVVAHALQTEADQDRPIISGETANRRPSFRRPIAPQRCRAVFLDPEAGVDADPTGCVCPRSNHDCGASRRYLQCRGSAHEHRHRGWHGEREDHTCQRDIITEVVNAVPEHRVVILEDTAEIQCSAQNAVLLHASDAADMARLLKSTIRFRPDRIIVGEVRDGAALTLLKAWNTCHPGGFATIHAKSAHSATDAPGAACCRGQPDADARGHPALRTQIAALFGSSGASISVAADYRSSFGQDRLHG